MKTQSLANLLSELPRRNHHDAAKLAQYAILRDNFKLTTWIALGASVQTIVSYLLPPAFAVAPVTLLLAYRILRTILVHMGLLHNKQMDGVLLGKHCIQPPGNCALLSEQPSGEDVAVLILAARSNHALGILGPGYRDVSEYINGMIGDLWDNADSHGFLGQTTWIAANERHTNNQVMVVCYFRSMEQLHAYAHGSMHNKAWRWWNRITATHPQLSIMHEMYHAPRNHWENVFINNHMTGIASMQTLTKDYDGKLRPLVDATRGTMRTQMGRLGRGDGKENEAYGTVSY